MTAKPAGEPRLRWTLFRNEHAGGYDVLDREMMFAHVPTLPEAKRIVAALNAAKTRAAQPGDAPKLTHGDGRLTVAKQIVDFVRANAFDPYMEPGDFANRIADLIVADDALLASRSTPAAPAARPGGEGTLSRLRKAVDACIYAGSRLNSLAESLVIEHRVSYQDYDASNVMSADWEAAKTDLCALLAELERPRDVPSV